MLLGIGPLPGWQSSIFLALQYTPTSATRICSMYCVLPDGSIIIPQPLNGNIVGKKSSISSEAFDWRHRASCRGKAFAKVAGMCIIPAYECFAPTHFSEEQHESH